MGKMRSLKELRIPIGMRNVKTTAAVFFCLLTYWFVGREDSFLAVTSAIICMQSDVESSFLAGVNRVAGTAIGALWGMLLRVVYSFLPFEHVGITFAVASLGTMLLIFVCNLIKQQESIVMAILVFLAIVLGESGDQPPLAYSLNRILDTSIGITIALVINRYLKMPCSLKRLFSRDGDVPEEYIEVDGGPQEQAPPERRQ